MTTGIALLIAPMCLLILAMRLSDTGLVATTTLPMQHF